MNSDGTVPTTETSMYSGSTTHHHFTHRKSTAENWLPNDFQVGWLEVAYIQRLHATFTRSSTASNGEVSKVSRVKACMRLYEAHGLGGMVVNIVFGYSSLDLGGW